MFRHAVREMGVFWAVLGVFYLEEWPYPVAITGQIQHKDPMFDQKKLVLKNSSKVQMPYLLFGLGSIPSDQFQPIQVKQIFEGEYRTMVFSSPDISPLLT